MRSRLPATGGTAEWGRSGRYSVKRTEAGFSQYLWGSKEPRPVVERRMELMEKEKRMTWEKIRGKTVVILSPL
jgi:hypothetical protein